jgi:hypothetical protein
MSMPLPRAHRRLKKVPMSISLRKADLAPIKSKMEAASEVSGSSTRDGRYNAGMRVLIVPLIISLGLAAGQTITPAERQAILAYQLNMPRANSLITTGAALSKYRASIPDFQANPAKYLTMTLSESIAWLEKDPKAMAILKQNGFSVRDYMIGFTALSMAYTIASGANAPDYVASPANVAFAKSNPQLLRELLAVLRVDTSKK